MDFERHIDVQLGVASEPDGRKTTIAKFMDNSESFVFKRISEVNWVKATLPITFDVLDNVGGGVTVHIVVFFLCRLSVQRRRTWGAITRSNNIRGRIRRRRK
jgi:hypothetical protein